MRRVAFALLAAGLSSSVAALFSLASSSCAPATEPASGAAMRVPAVARDAGPPRAVAPPLPLDVRVTFLGDDGAYMGPFYDPRPDAAALVRPCFERARDADRTLAGFVLFDVALTQGAPARVSTREASALPASLVACAATALEALRPRDPTFVPAPSVAYVSVR